MTSTNMCSSVPALLAAIRSSLRTRAELEAEILALRHQLAGLQQAAPRRLRLSPADRLLWVLLSRGGERTPAPPPRPWPRMASSLPPPPRPGPSPAPPRRGTALRGTPAPVPG